MCVDVDGSKVLRARSVVRLCKEAIAIDGPRWTAFAGPRWTAFATVDVHVRVSTVARSYMRGRSFDVVKKLYR